MEDSEHQADWFVVYDRPKQPLLTKVPKERRILMVAEPPEFQSYPKSFLDQFGIILTSYPIANAEGQQFITQTALPWFYGMNVGGSGKEQVSKYWDELAAPTLPSQDRKWEITAICSTKMQTKNQVRRLRFLKILQDVLGDRLVVFGRGFATLEDKAEVIDQSQYHLCLENNILPNGWTEKTADPILGGAFPIHGGAQHIENDFDANGLLWVDLTNPKQSAQKIRTCLDNEIVFSAAAQSAMLGNKQRLMESHNLFALFARLIKQFESEQAPVEPLVAPQEIVWYKPSRLSKILKPPRVINRLIWQSQIALLERG